MWFLILTLISMLGVKRLVEYIIMIADFYNVLFLFIGCMTLLFSLVFVKNFIFHAVD